MSDDKVVEFPQAAAEQYEFQDLNWAPEGSGSMDPGEYADWVRMVLFLSGPKLDTLEDFLPESVITDERLLSVVTSYIELGKWQYNARCNNRLATLDRMQREIELIDQRLEGELQEPDANEADEIWARYRYLGRAEIPAPELHELRVHLAASVDQEWSKIDDDIAAGVFADHGELRKALATPSGTDGRIGKIAGLMPYFLAKAFTICRATETNTRRKHTEASLARDIYYDDPRALQAAIAMKRLRSPRRSSSSGSEPDRGGDDE